jgi:hypothetical protein
MTRDSRQRFAAAARAAFIAACVLVACAWASIVVAVLPSAWVGTPYMSLTYWLNPGIDAPDNWAVAFTYVYRIATGLGLAALGMALLAYGCRRIGRTTAPSEL